MPDNTRDKETDQGFQIVQVRGTPDHFRICKPCPAITPKTLSRKNTSPKKIPRVKNTISLPHKQTIHFAHASSDLTEDDRTALGRLIKSLPETYRLTITGYTDSTGRPASNQKLARLRALSVSNHLESLGVDKRNLILKASPLCCYITSNTTASGRAKNRRTEIIISTIANEGIKP